VLSLSSSPLLTFERISWLPCRLHSIKTLGGLHRLRTYLPYI
jgi:hypothetical protein